jgi:hypothetical protein
MSKSKCPKKNLTGMSELEVLPLRALRLPRHSFSACRAIALAKAGRRVFFVVKNLF